MRRLVPVFLLSLSLLLLSALLLTGSISAQAPDPPPKGADPSTWPQPTEPVSPLTQVNRGLLTKIEPQLFKRLIGGDEAAPFIVYLKAKTDVPAVAAAANRAVTPGQPPELARRQAIVEALQQTARSSQAGVLQLLNSSAAPGGVSGQSIATTDINPLWVVNAVAAKGSLETVLALAARTDVEIVRLDRQISLNHPPLVDQERLLSPKLQTEQWGVPKIRADLVHNALGIDGSGVVVANVDTGVDWQHPDLQAQYRGYTGAGHLTQHAGNWYDATGDGAAYPVDGNGHGTHTMGTIVGTNGIGVAPGASWIAVKAFNSGGNALSSWLHDAYEWLLAPNGDPALAPDVVNNSWSNNNGANLEFEADVEALLNAGIYPIFSAGNNGSDSSSVGSPGSLPLAFAVGATTIDDEIATFSGRGPSAWGKIKPDVSAPGKDILSTFPGGAYGNLNGTSMAAPHVAGLAALLLQASPGLGDNLEGLSHVITSTATPSGETTPNNDYGWGRIDAYNAVMSVAGAGTMEGVVAQAGNGPVINRATIQMVPRDGGPTVSTLSGADGAYIQGLAAGTYDVTASAFGYQSETFFNQTVVTGTPAIRNFALTPAPVGTLQGTVRSQATNAPLAATVFINGAPVKSETNPNNGAYSLSLPVGTYTLRVVAEGHRVGRVSNIIINDGATVTQDFALDTAPSILLVDSGKWYQESQINYYRQALNDALYSYDVWQIAKPFETPNDVPITSTLTAYDIVIWSAPQDSPGYVGADKALTGFLDNGGKLLLSGQDVAYFDNQINGYFKSHLYSRFIADNAGTDVITGSEDSPFAGLSVTISGAGGADNQTTPDVVAVTDSDFAKPLLAYGDDSLAGVYVGLCVPYRAMFLGIGLEGINSRADRRQVMERSIDWLMEQPAARGVEFTSPPETKIGNFGTVVTHPLRIRNVGTLPDSYNLTVDSNWPVNPAPPADVSLESCQSQTITVGVQVETESWHEADTLTLTATGNGVSDTITRTTKSPAPVLLVNDDRFFDYSTAFQTSLSRNKINYDYWLVPKSWNGPAPPSPSLETLQMYPIVVWYTAYDWFQPLLPEEEERLAAYLEGGGRFFFSSQDYIYNLPDNKPGDFARNYLGVLDHTEDYSSTMMIGQMGHPISTNLGRNKLTFPPSYRNSTDGLSPTEAAQVVSLGEEEQINALSLTGEGNGGRAWRTTFLAYGPELLAEDVHARLMQRAVGWLGWLGTSTTMPDRDEALAGELINYTAVIANDGWSDLTTAHFTATFPAELALNAASFSPELTLSEGQLLWSGPLARGEQKVFNYSATLADPLPLGTVVSQTNWIAYDAHDIVVDRVANVCGNCPDLSESRFQVTPAQGVEAGDVLTYTIVLKNTGLVDDPMITTTNTLPHMLEWLVVDEPSQGNIVQEDDSLTWMTPLSKNQTVTLTYQAVISYRTSEATIENIALVEDVTNLPSIELEAQASYQVFPVYLPIIHKD